MQRIGKRIFWAGILCILLFACTACQKKKTEQQASEQTETVPVGAVETSDSFEPLGMIIDVTASNMITDVSYEIVTREIAVVHFVYNGIDCEYRASAVYNNFELAGIENTGDGGIIASSVQGYNATYYKLNPGRAVFWNDDHIHYSLYVYVTAEDSVLDSILALLTFEDHYEKRADAIQNKEALAKTFAEQIVSVVQNRDKQALSEIVNYPFDIGSEQTVSNQDALTALDEADIFTEALVAAVDTDALDNLRAGRDEDSYLIGSSTKNVYFRLTEENTYKIIKINN